MILAAGERMTEEIHKLCRQAWREGKIPEEWTILVTIPKKGDLMECSNYRTIALLNHMSKVLMKVLQERLKAQTDTYITDEQAGFRKDRNTIQQILRLMAEKAYRKGKQIYHCFIDF